MENQRQTGDSKLLNGINTLSNDVLSFKAKCENLRRLMDEGSYKLDAALNIINNLKVQEKNIISAAGDPVAVKQMSEEQIDGLLEMLKTPAFQSIAKQAMVKLLNQSAPSQQ